MLPWTCVIKPGGNTWAAVLGDRVMVHYVTPLPVVWYYRPKPCVPGTSVTGLGNVLATAGTTGTHHGKCNNGGYLGGNTEPLRPSLSARNPTVHHAVAEPKPATLRLTQRKAPAFPNSRMQPTYAHTTAQVMLHPAAC